MSTSRHPIHACRPVTSLTRENVFNESETPMRARTRPRIIVRRRDVYFPSSLCLSSLLSLSFSLKVPGESHHPSFFNDASEAIKRVPKILAKYV